MDKPKLSYFEKEDILYLTISTEKESGSVEITPNITAELNQSGELIGIEITSASSFLRDSILESTQAKLLQISKQVA
ncbi:DNA polymerase III subunit alpha [Achromatium sp. WMS3]|nr:DNA polymerase III subunit alpha [Achromatium sp. WMS3]